MNRKNYLGLDKPLHLTLNAAFLSEIKQDNIQFRQLIDSIADALNVEAKVRPRVLAELLERLRDEMDSHFALEEFYGYFDSAALVNPQVNSKATMLREQHVDLSVELNGLLEETERIVYQERPQGRSLDEIIDAFLDFHRAFMSHEDQEMELMMRLANEEIGVGD